MSAAITIAGPRALAATSSAFANASLRTKSCGDSAGIGVSSTAEESTENCIPAERKISARRGDADASISFIVCFERILQELQDYRLLILAKDASKRVRNFADGSKRFHCGQNCWQKIFVGSGAPFEFHKRPAGLGSIASAA